MSTEQQDLNQLIEERMRQVIYGTDELPPLIHTPEQAVSNEKVDVVEEATVVSTPTIATDTISIPQAPQPIMNTPVSAMPTGIPVVSAPASTDSISEKKAPTIKKSNSSHKKEPINIDQVAETLVANFVTMDKMAIHESLLQIIGKSSSGLAKSLNMSPANVILTSIRGGRQLSDKNLDVVVNAFITDPNIEARPQIKALITKDLFLANKPEENPCI